MTQIPYICVIIKGYIAIVLKDCKISLPSCFVFVITLKVGDNYWIRATLKNMGSLMKEKTGETSNTYHCLTSTSQIHVLSVVLLVKSWNSLVTIWKWGIREFNYKYVAKQEHIGSFIQVLSPFYLFILTLKLSWLD